MKQMEFTILGQGYILGCEEGGEAWLKAAAETVDREMTAIRDGGKIKARERIAVLAALNLAYRLAGQTPGTASGAAGTAALTPTAGAGRPDGLDAEEVDALVRRLDAALGADGHLL